jgi:hypothetical protein
MNIRVFMASALALAAIASSANALTITAKDNVAYTVKVMPKGAKEIDLALKANGSADVDCKNGCQLSLNGNTHAVDGTVSKIFIQAGKFVM